MCRLTGAYAFGIDSTLISFIALGNYSIGMQLAGKIDFNTQYLENGDMHGMIAAFYTTSFYSVALTASCYSCNTLKDDQ